MEKKLCEKERLMFQAVIELIEEGMDIYSMKVSDITSRAGVGKGTAYEYFSSKEELIAKALFWIGNQHFQAVFRFAPAKPHQSRFLCSFRKYIQPGP